MDEMKLLEQVFNRLPYKPGDKAYLINDQEGYEYIVIGVVLLQVGIMYQLLSPIAEMLTVYEFCITDTKPI